MKFDFNGPFLQHDTTPFKDEKGQPMMMNKILARNLEMNTSYHDIIKLREWSRSLYKDGVIDLDQSDTITLKNIISGIQDMYAIVKWHLLDVLDRKQEKAAEPDTTGNNVNS